MLAPSPNKGGLVCLCRIEKCRGPASASVNRGLVARGSAIAQEYESSEVRLQSVPAPTRTGRVGGCWQAGTLARQAGCPMASCPGLVVEKPYSVPTRTLPGLTSQSSLSSETDRGTHSGRARCFARAIVLVRWARGLDKGLGW